MIEQHRHVGDIKVLYWLLFMSSTQHKYLAQTFTFLHNATLTEQIDSSFTQYKTLECDCHGLSCQSTSATLESL